MLVATQEHSNETAVDKTEEGGDDVKSSCLYDLGYTRTTMAITEGSKTAMWSEPLKVVSVRIAGCTRLREVGNC